MTTANHYSLSGIKRWAILASVVSALLILLFIYTAASKLMDHVHFQMTLSRSPLLERFSLPISWVIPAMEILISVLLFFPTWRKTGFILSTILMACFTLYIGYMILFTPHLPCSCGGVLKELTWRQHLVFNMFFTALSFLGWMAEKKLKFLL